MSPYLPPRIVDIEGEPEDDLVDVPHEELVLGAGVGSWYSLLAHDEDDD